MKQKFRLEDYIGSYAMHCDTEEKAEKFLRFLNNNCCKWFGGKSYCGDLRWKSQRENTVYYFNEGLYGDVRQTKRLGVHTILEFDDFDWSKNKVSDFEQKIVITTDGKTTEAKLYKNKKIIKSANSKCSPDDEFDFMAGALLAFLRLDKECSLNKPKLYTGKVICVKNDYSKFFTIGKTYSIKNGLLIDDKGFKSFDGIVSLTDLNKRSFARWIEAIE